MNPPQSILDLAKAIAHAEGFGIEGAVPTRAHNPGDLKVPHWEGEVIGAEGITVFPDDETGWNHLYSQLLFIMNKQSHVYSLIMTFAQFSQHWTDTAEGAWLDNVIYELQELGYTSVDKNTTLGSFFGV